MTTNPTTKRKPWGPPWGPSKLEADVTLSDGTVLHVNGLYAVEYHKDPERVGPLIERNYRNHQERKRIADDMISQGFSFAEAWRRANFLVNGDSS